jgi:hypothetical protein
VNGFRVRIGTGARVAGLTAIGAAALGAMGVTHADALNDTAELSLGTFLLTTNTTVRVDGSGREGTPVNLEHGLGITNHDSFRLDGYWRFLTKHKIRVMYFDQNRSASRTIDQEIEFNGETYPINTDVSTRLDTRIFEVAYEYAFLRSEHYELSGSVGLHNVTFDLSLAATGTTQNVSTSAKASVDGPLPVFGLHYVYQLNPQVSFDLMGQFFKLKFQQYDGSIQDYTASVIYMPWKNVGIGGGWNSFITNVNVDASKFNGNLNWRYGGVRLFVNLAY